MISEKTILNIQNVSAFFIGNYSLFLYLSNTKQSLSLISTMIMKHAFFDLMVNKSYDLIMHHLCIFGFCLYYNYHNVLEEDVYTIFKTLLNTEISTIFYVLKYWLPENSMIYNANILVFYATFFKFRIYDFYKILHNHTEFIMIFDKYSYGYLSNISVLSIYILYILNLYWFTVMTKILYKKINICNTYLLNHQICSYLHLVNIPVSIYVYSYKPNVFYLFDLTGIGMLALSTYDFHSDIYLRLKNKKIDDYTLPTSANFHLMIQQCVSIHARSWLSILTNYYHVKNFYYILIVSTIFHGYSIFLCNMNTLQLFLDYDKNNEVFLICHKIILGVPIACDYFLIFMSSPIEIAIPFLLINIYSIIWIKVKPLYNLSDIGIQILSIAQTYYLCLSNINSIYH